MADIAPLRVPRGLPDLEPMTLEMFNIYQAERRIDEISVVNSVKAPELLKTFNKAYLELSNYIAMLEFEYETATAQQKQIRAVIILDQAPRILREKGLVSDKNPSGSVDQREAIVEIDPKYKQITEIAYNLKCYISLLEGKKDSIEKAYTAVKRILPDNSARRPNANLYVNRNGEENG